MVPNNVFKKPTNAQYIFIKQWVNEIKVIMGLGLYRKMNSEQENLVTVKQVVFYWGKQQGSVL